MSFVHCTKRILLALLLILLLVPRTDAFDVEPDGRRLVRFGCYDLKSFINKNASGDYYGYGVDYLRMLSAYTGWCCEPVVAENKDLARMLKSGEIDFLMPVEYAEDRLDRFAYPSYPLGEQINGLYMLKSRKNIYYEDFKAFQGLRVGSVEKTFPTDSMRGYAKEHGFSYREVLYPQLALVHKALEAGSVDLVCRSGLGNIPGDYRLVGATDICPFYIVASADGKHSPMFIQLDRAVKRIRYEHPDFMGQLFTKYNINKRTTDGFAALTREDVKYLSAHPSAVVMSFSDRYPIAYAGKDGKPAGIIIDLMQLVSEKTGLKFTYKSAPKGVVLADQMLSGDVKTDLLAGLVNSGVYRSIKNLRVSEGLLGNILSIAGRKGQAFDPARAYTVSVVASATGTIDRIRKNHPDYKIITFDSTADCLRAVISGQADAAIQNVNVLNAQLQHPEFNGLSAWHSFIDEQGFNYCVAGRVTADPRLISIINKGIDALNAEDVQSVVIKHTYAPLENMTPRDYFVKYRAIIPHILLLIAICLFLAIRSHRAKQRHLFVLQRANSALVEATANANAASEESKRANRAKSDFLSRMSHDIRTPLNGVIGMTALARAKNFDPEVDDYLSKIDISGHFLLGLVNDILDISKIDAGKMEIHAEPYPESEFLSYLGSVIVPMFKEKGVILEREGAFFSDNVAVIDKLKYNRIFFNLLANAVKFTPAGGHVRVSVANGKLENGILSYDVTVTDDGIGMSEDFMKKIFSPFEQEETAGANNGGSGLGLAITYKFVKLMGGDISVKSAPGQGTEFKLHFSFPTINACQLPPQEQAEPEQIDLAGSTYLVAEDNDINSEIIMHILHDRGAKVVLAQNGLEALLKFEESAPNTFSAILMDVRMPVIDGKEAARQIRALSRRDAKTVPIIAATANAYDEDVKSCLEAGMDAHIAKPIEPDQLFALLAKMKAAKAAAANKS